MNWDDLFIDPNEFVGQTFSFNVNSGSGFFRSDEAREDYQARQAWKRRMYAQFYGAGPNFFRREYEGRFEPEDPPEGYRDEMGCRTWLCGRWVDDEEVARKEWTPSLIYSYDLVIPDDAIEAGVEDGAFVITHLDKVVGSDIALLHDI